MYTYLCRLCCLSAPADLFGILAEIGFLIRFKQTSINRKKPFCKSPKTSENVQTHMFDDFVRWFWKYFLTISGGFFAILAQLCLVSDKEHGPSAIYHLVFDDDDRDTRGIQKRFLHAYTSSWLIFWLLYLLLSICLFVHLSLCWDT